MNTKIIEGYEICTNNARGCMKGIKDYVALAESNRGRRVFDKNRIEANLEDIKFAAEQLIGSVKIGEFEGFAVKKETFAEFETKAQELIQEIIQNAKSMNAINDAIKYNLSQVHYNLRGFNDNVLYLIQKANSLNNITYTVQLVTLIEEANELCQSIHIEGGIALDSIVLKYLEEKKIAAKTVK